MNAFLMTLALAFCPCDTVECVDCVVDCDCVACDCQVAPQSEPFVVDEPTLYLSLFVHSDYENRPEELRLMKHFEEDARLLSLRKYVHFGISREGETNKYPILPAVVLQKKRIIGNEVTYPNVHKAVGDAIPVTATVLYHDLARYVEVPERRRRFFRGGCDGGNCYRDSYGPQPVPIPHPQPEPDVPDEPGPEPEPVVVVEKEDEIPPGVKAALVIGAIGVGVIIGFAVALNRYKNENF